MARPIRIEDAGAVYHVMARGNQGQRICLDEADRRLWLATLGAALGRTGWQVHAWVLMGDHYHLLLETPEPNLVAGMKWLQGTYTQRYNARHRKRGHLFQGRYRAIPVERGGPEYFEQVSTYIHSNPARAKQVRSGQEKLWTYRWSSYPCYVGRGTLGAEWLVRERVMGSVGLGPEERRAYEIYLEGRVLELGMKTRRRELEAQWRQLRRGWYVGGERFRARLLGKARRRLLSARSASPRSGMGQAHGEAAAERMLERGLRCLNLRREKLALTAKGLVEKQVLAWWLYERTTVTRRWVAERLVMGYESRVSQAVAWVEHTANSQVLEMKANLIQCHER